jgi:hypothetical protein
MVKLNTTAAQYYGECIQISIFLLDNFVLMPIGDLVEFEFEFWGQYMILGTVYATDETLNN